jgi:hypothetical protein
MRANGTVILRSVADMIQTSIDRPFKAWLMKEMIGKKCGFCGTTYAVAPRNQPRDYTYTVCSGCIGQYGRTWESRVSEIYGDEGYR